MPTSTKAVRVAHAYTDNRDSDRFAWDAIADEMNDVDDTNRQRILDEARDVVEAEGYDGEEFTRIAEST